MALPDQPADVIRWEPQVPKDWRAAIGKVALFAAQAEEQLHLVFWHYLGVSPEEGQVITGDRQAKRLSDDLIKIARINCQNKSRLADLELLINECDNLFPLRNRCMHWIWNNVIGDKSSTMRPLYRATGTPVEFDITKLEQLGDELAWLKTRLAMHAMGDSEIRRERQGESSPRMQYLFWPAPWLDTPAAPATTPSPGPQRRKARSRQPRPSRA